MNTRLRTRFEPRLLVLAMLLGVSVTAAADHDHDRPEYSSSHEQIVYGKVIEVTPVYRQVRVTTPVKECWSEPVRHTDWRKFWAIPCAVVTAALVLLIATQRLGG